MCLIFQYGSNCLTARLNSRERLNGAAEEMGCAQTVNEYEIAFDVWSESNNCAAADLIPATGTGRFPWGVLYKTSERGLARLREVEGRRYEEIRIPVRTTAGQEVEATTFFVKFHERKECLWTSAEYVGYIVKGLREHGTPEQYTQQVVDVAIRTNEKAEDQNHAKARLPLITELRQR